MLISIVIPLYNKEKYITKCLKSLINQTYKELEILVINDGSTDRGNIICEKIAKEDNRIKLISTKNNGVSNARNIGISNAKGKKILFVDADDYVESTYIENLAKYANCDLVLSGYKEIYNESIKTNFLEKKIFENLKDFIKYMFNKRNIRYILVPYAKLFNLDLIKDNKIKFPENTNYGEDVIFVLEYIKYVKKVKTIDKTEYYNLIIKDSLSHRHVDKIFEKNMQTFYKCKEILNEKKYKKYVNFFFMKAIANILYNEAETNYDNYENICYKIKNKMQENHIKLSESFDIYYSTLIILLKLRKYKTIYKLYKLKRR